MLLVVVGPTLRVEPVVELLQRLRGLLQNLLGIGEIVHVFLVRGVLSGAVGDLVGLRLLIVGQVGLLLRDEGLETSLLVLDLVRELGDGARKRVHLGLLLVLGLVVGLAFGVAPVELLVVLALFLSD